MLLVLLAPLIMSPASFQVHGNLLVLQMYWQGRRRRGEKEGRWTGVTASRRNKLEGIKLVVLLY